MKTCTRTLRVATAALALLWCSANRAGAAAPTPAPSGTFCGNGLLDAGESCTTCADDCVVRRCQPEGTASFAVQFAPPPKGDPSSVTVKVGYRSELLAMPGTGLTSYPRDRIRPTSKSVLVVNDLDYALRIVASSGSQVLPAGELVTIRFDTCRGTRLPTVADVSCAVEGCAGRYGAIDGCSCSVVAAPSVSTP